MLPAMEMEAGGPGSRKRKSVELESPEPVLAPAAAGAEAPVVREQSPPSAHRGEAPPGADEQEGGGNDHISQLPDAILGKIISLLPTKEGVRTQVLASSWRHLWRSTAPLNLDCDDLLARHGNIVPYGDTVSLVLSTHPGPSRRFHFPAHRLRDVLFPAHPRLRDEAVVADHWLPSPALRDLQELWLYYSSRRVLTWGTLFRFQRTLRVLAMGRCHLADHAVEALHFPRLRLLELAEVTISQRALQGMINRRCPALECLLIKGGNGFRSVQINSRTLRGIGLLTCAPGTEELVFGELVIKNAPRLERLLHRDQRFGVGLHVSVISAPKLQTLGCLSDLHEHPTRSDLFGHSTRFEFGATTIQGCRVNGLMTMVHTIKILCVDMRTLNLDTIIDFMRCFPCLEKLYVQSSAGGKNLWRRKHQNLIRSLDIPLKTLVLANYRGTRSQVNFSTFFVLNAKVLELMMLQVGMADEEFIAEQRMKLQLEKRASRGARFHFIADKYLRTLSDVTLLRDLDLTDPFARRCWN